MNTFTPKSKLCAFTKSGIDLGKVVLIEVDPATGRITSFFISSSHVIPRLLEAELIVSWNQVIDWDQEKIIVADAAVPAEAKNIALAPNPSKKAGAHLKEA
jgi:sporulation protein YlmC with PRC-barrel domain